MTALSCAHGFPSPASCVDCMEEGPVAPPTASTPATIEATFRAKYDGHCTGCNLPVGIGQVVHRLSEGRYVHQGCE